MTGAEEAAVAAGKVALAKVFGSLYDAYVTKLARPIKQWKTKQKIVLIVSIRISLRRFHVGWGVAEKKACFRIAAIEMNAKNVIFVAQRRSDTLLLGICSGGELMRRAPRGMEGGTGETRCRPHYRAMAFAVVHCGLPGQ